MPVTDGGVEAVPDSRICLTVLRSILKGHYESSIKEVDPQPKQAKRQGRQNMAPLSLLK